MKPALRSVPPSRSPEREALAAAIAAERPVIEATNPLRAKAEKARGRVVATQADHAVAADALAAATARAADGDGTVADLRALHQAEADAADEAALARGALNKAEAALAEAERAAGYARDRLASAADAVLAVEFATIHAAAVRASREAARLAWVVEVLAEAGHPWDGTRHRLRGEAQVLNAGILAQTSVMAEREAMRAEAQAPWSAARAALLADPDAALPEIT